MKGPGIEREKKKKKKQKFKRRKFSIIVGPKSNTPVNVNLGELIYENFCHFMFVK